ncbi:flagellin [Bacillus cytotoxicus]|uniref:flagellin N-terminal helical domain-containing protein n=1 Tax=Bacillus cytotoxicus TaxID=580165 RepID=UPI003D7DD44C
MRINTNINSMRTQEYMRQNQAKMSTAMDRLSSGKRINNAADDAAGLAIATRMRARESGLNVAANNTQDGMSLIRTADSAMNSVSNILLRMRDLANQSANGTNTNGNQAALNKEFDALKEQINYISANTEFNDKKLLDGSNQTIAIQTLDNADKDKKIVIQLTDVSTKGLQIDDLKIISGPSQQTVNDVANTSASSVNDVKTKVQNATQKSDADVKAVTDDPSKVAIASIDAALEKIASSRATLGATLNRLDFNVTNLKSQSTSMAAAASQIEDADMAKEMSEMTKFKILNEAGISMLSQANQTPQMVSKLLQ